MSAPATTARPAVPAPEHITTQEIMALLRCCDATVYSMVRDGRLPKPIKVGRRHLFNRKKVLALLQSK